MKYNPDIVKAYFRDCGLPECEVELKFCETRKWKFDFAWEAPHFLALEVQGGIFTGGRHTQGAALLKEYEKLNAAASRGWRVMFCIPRDLCMDHTMQYLKNALGVTE